jgi:hypothetical protein
MEYYLTSIDLDNRVTTGAGGGRGGFKFKQLPCITLHNNLTSPGLQWTYDVTVDRHTIAMRSSAIVDSTATVTMQ